MTVLAVVVVFLTIVITLVDNTTMWYARGATSNEGLIDNLVSEGIISSRRVAQMMKAVDRADFCIPTAEPYVDSPQLIGEDQTISAPHMHAMCLELLEKNLFEGAKVLDVGSGSGYLSAVFGKAVGKTGKVIGIDIYEDLVDKAKRNIEKGAPDLLEEGIVTIKLGDGWLGEAEEGPFDAIHVGAGAASLPRALIQQLKPGGRLVIPVGPEFRGQTLKCIDKDKNGEVHSRDITLCTYVPLQRRQH